jgi:exocyst complex component 3
LLGLEGQEYVSLLQWVEQTYPGPELMGSSALNIDKHLIPPLLAPEVVDALMSSYLDNMRENYSSWMRVNHMIFNIF